MPQSSVNAMRRRWVVGVATFGLLAAGATLGAQADEPVRVAMYVDSSDYYPWISQLSMGKVRWSRTERDSTVGRRYRAVVLTSEIFSTLVIERIGFGIEGCCAKVEWSRLVRLGDVRQRMGWGQAIVGLRIESWPSDSTFVFVVKSHQYLATISGPQELRLVAR
jgi:hypothetical protein